VNTQTILTAARMACYREIPDYYNTKNLAIGPWRAGYYVADHPRVDSAPLNPLSWKSRSCAALWTTEFAYDYTSTQATPQELSDFMTYFANHVRDALKFDY